MDPLGLAFESYDSMGVWRARGRKGNDTVDIAVDKGGRIKVGPR